MCMCVCLPSAYVVRREGNVLTRVCPSMILSVHGGGGVRSVQPGGSRGQVSPAGGGVRSGAGVMGQASSGGVVAGGRQARSWGDQASNRGGVRPVTGGVSWGGSAEGGGSTKIGQQNEYSLYGGRYASCVHAGGLSCFSVCS